MNNPSPHQPVPTPATPQSVYYAPIVPVRPTKTNGLAVAGMVLGILWLYWVGSILAVIFGHVALHQCNKNQNEIRAGRNVHEMTGKGMAIAAITLGWIGVGILATILLLGAAASGA